jgi:hypothetical protein
MLTDGSVFCLQVYAGGKYPLYEDGRQIAVTTGFVIEREQGGGVTGPKRPGSDIEESLLILRKPKEGIAPSV